MKPTDYLHWLQEASRGYKLRIFINGVIGITNVGISLLFIGISKHLIDIATHHTQGNILLYAMLLIGCTVIRLAASTVSARLNVCTETDMRNQLRQHLFSHLMNSQWTGRETLHTGDVLNRLEEDLYTVTGTLCHTLPAIATTCVQLAGAFFFLLHLDARLAGIIVFITPLALLSSKTYIRRIRRLTRDIRDNESLIQAHIQENLQHRTLISTLEYTSQTNHALHGLQTQLRKQILRRNNFSLFSRAVMQVGFSAGYITAFLWGINGMATGTVTFGMMAAFLQLVTQVQRPMADLGKQIPTLVRTSTSIERLAELTRLPVEAQGTPVWLEGRAGIRAEHLTFTYPGGNREILKDFSHDFRPGSFTAVFGETGAGKSTLMRLILALLKPDSGRIVFYTDKEEAAISPRLRCNLAYVPQGNTLISGTIRDNLLLGNPRATDLQLREALHTAAADFVYSLPEGLNTLCGEWGTGLSEGQAQRIAIARGLLRPGSILLLDEPTSALDDETEQILLNRLSHAAQEKTLILITHRESTAQLCSQRVTIKRNKP